MAQPGEHLVTVPDKCVFPPGYFEQGVDAWKNLMDLSLREIVDCRSGEVAVVLEKGDQKDIFFVEYGEAGVPKSVVVVGGNWDLVRMLALVFDKKGPINENLGLRIGCFEVVDKTGRKWVNYEGRVVGIEPSSDVIECWQTRYFWGGLSAFEEKVRDYGYKVIGVGARGLVRGS